MKVTFSTYLTLQSKCDDFAQEQESQSAGSTPIANIRHSYAGETIAECTQEASEVANDTSIKVTTREVNLGKIQFSLTYDFHDMALNLKV